jgi:CspA family cold shock protein
VVQHDKRVWLHQARRGGPDVFVQISAIQKAGISGLAEGAKVSYELVTGRTGKASAEQPRIGRRPMP